VLIGTARAGGSGNRLELAAAGTTVGTIAAIGTSFIGFGTVTVDTAASWSLAGASTLAAGTTFANAGTVTVAGTFDTAGSVLNRGSIAGRVGLAGGYLYNAGTATMTAPTGLVVDGSGGSPTVRNLGAISAGRDSAIYMTAGTVVNGAGGVTGAIITGGTGAQA